MNIKHPHTINISDYNYNLPDAYIAKYPLKKRNSSKLLLWNDGAITDSHFVDLPQYIPQGSLMVFNNSKVIQARLHFSKSTGAAIEIFCLEPQSPANYLQNFEQTHSCSWLCIIGNLKKWKEGTLLKSVSIRGCEVELRAQKGEACGDSHLIHFSWNNQDATFADILEAAGELPIPPYLNRETEESDLKTYQTVYSKIEGSVAAPTAGLHFTDDVFLELKNRGIETAEVTLHVGAGTFKPVKSELIGEHRMHAEFIAVERRLIEKLCAHRGTIIAVGTTSVRTLESIYYIGQMLEHSAECSLVVNQWLPYEWATNQITKLKALENILNYLDRHKIDKLIASTQIMIAPGYQFKIVDGIVTNFHQPKSTLLLLISAFVGEGQWSEIYNHALQNKYRFLSYGDSSLLLKK